MNDYPGYMIARPTEYRGVKFRSKSEAIFARALDLGKWVWKYEPEDMRLENGWVPDFWIVMTKPVNPTIVSVVVEYKPSHITQTYLQELTSRMIALSDRMIQTSFGLATGSPWDHVEARKFTVLTQNGWVESARLRKHTLDLMGEALDYRFDLQSAGD